MHKCKSYLLRALNAFSLLLLLWCGRNVRFVNLNGLF